MDFLIELKIKPVLFFQIQSEESLIFIEKTLDIIKTKYDILLVQDWHIILGEMPSIILSENEMKPALRFMELYLNAYKKSKSINLKLKIGSPIFPSEILINKNLVKMISDFFDSENCLPDFVNISFFTENSFEESSLKIRLQNLAASIKSSSFESLPLHMTKCNFTSHPDRLNDTIFKSAYMVKSILENNDIISNICINIFQDQPDSSWDFKELFYGGNGLITYNGIYKSVYYALNLISKLGKHLLLKGEGFFITHSENGFQVLLYNYQHISKQSRLKIVLPLINIENGNYVIKNSIINMEFGSSYDKLKDFGFSDLINREDINYLNSISVPRVTKELISINESNYILNAELEPNEVRLIEISFV